MTEQPDVAPAVVALCADLFFTSRVESAARRAGRRFASARAIEDLRSVLADLHPSLVMVDLATYLLDIGEAVAVARAAGVATVVAFGPHRDVAGRRRALAAGCDEWQPNSKLTAELPRLLE